MGNEKLEVRSQKLGAQMYGKMLAKCVEMVYNINREGSVNALDKIVNVNFRLSAADKKRFENACTDMGMSVSTALTIFAKMVGRERRIPFEITADMFYSESNMEHLRRGVAALNAGQGEEHELIEEDDV